MCRFAIYLGPPITLAELLTRPRHSLIRQSYQSKERDEPLNGDGFGVSWYVPELSPNPGFYRSVSPAWNNGNLLSMAPVTRSHCIFAHVRAATAGLQVNHANCHPFCHERFSFMHNGHVAGFREVRRELMGGLSDASFQMIRGDTDSELMFAMLLDRHRELTALRPLERLAQAMQLTIRDVRAATRDRGVEGEHQLNLAVTDGERVVVSRCALPKGPANTLYVLTGQGYDHAETTWGLEPPRSIGDAAIVASEALGPGRGWKRVPDQHLVLLDEDRSMKLRPLSVS